MQELMVGIRLKFVNKGLSYNTFVRFFNVLSPERLEVERARVLLGYTVSAAIYFSATAFNTC
jgi:hypothetical protein